MIDKVIQYLIYGLVAVLPWQTVYLIREVFVEGEKWQYGTIGLYASDIVMMAIILLVGWTKRKDVLSWIASQRRSPSAIAVALLAMICYLGMSAAWSQDPPLTMMYTIRIVCGVFLVQSIRVTKINIKVFIAVLSISMAVSALLAIGQFMVQKDFGSTALGLSHHSAHMGGTSVIEVDGERWLRAYGSFPHPNILGGIMGVMIVFMVGVAPMFSTSARWRILSITTVIICFTALLTSFSRSGLIGLIAGMIALYFLQQVARKQGYTSKKIFVVAAASMSTLCVIFYASYSNLWQARVNNDTRLEKLSVQERTSQVTQALKVVRQNSITGVGMGTYTLHIASQERSQQPIWRYQPVHNTPLLILAEIGLVGVTLLAMLMAMLARNAYISGKERRYSLSQAVGASLVALFVTGIFDHWHWSSQTGILIITLFFGLLFGQRARSSEDDQEGGVKKST
jgi:O-antigen ligase